LEGSIGGNGSASPSQLLEKSWFETSSKNAATMEFDVSLSREEAEREAWALVWKLYRQHRG
jgi:hypothetical protein